MTFDAIVIGSGFGGAVVACRLAEAGRAVLILERGRQWTPDQYPRGVNDDWIFDVDEPHRQNGWVDLRFLDDMWVAQGAGVGGGSLIYANVSIDAPKAVFESGWPGEITFNEMREYYARVAGMLKPEVLPDSQLTPRFTLMRDAAAATEASHRFRKVELAVSFDPDAAFPPAGRRPAEAATREFTNAFGQKQGYCVHAGNCDIGCKAQAKNTLDLNYLAVAKRHGAKIRPLSLVSHVAAEGDRFAVVYDDIRDGKRVERVERAAKVFLAAGSLGSTELLFRSRDVYRGLPKVSAALGRNWSSNGDFLTPAFYAGRTLSPTLGPTITAAIDFLDGSDGGARYFVEDGGFPDVLGNVVRAAVKRGRFRPGARLLKLFAALAYDGDTLERMMPWFGQAIDAGDGRLYYGRDWLRPWRRRLKLDWDVARSENAIGGLIAAHERLSAATVGKAEVPATWRVLRNLVTPHPLGGCGMAASPAAGTVDHAGRVFGYPGLFVVDGAIVPRPIGLNPSKTIAALAERAASIFLGS